MNYYEVLEVSAKASPAVIKAAYKSLVQRYHPDKNNNDAASVLRTAQIVQAYEVLSDDVRRAGYDQQIQSHASLHLATKHAVASRLTPAAAHAFAKTAQKSQGYWVVWLLIIATIVLALWFLLPKSKPTTLDQPPALAAAITDLQANRPLANHRLLMLEIAVNLIETEKLPPDSVKMIKIPLLALSITHPDAKRLLWHLDDRKHQLRQNIETKLTFARSGQLMQDDGPKYLRELVWQTVSEMAAAHSPEFASEAYNIDIDLPKAFTVGLYVKPQLQTASEK